jgi:hypothetical protein
MYSFREGKEGAYAPSSGVDTLTRRVIEAQAYLQRMAATASFEGEVSVDEYRRLCADAIAFLNEIYADETAELDPALAALQWRRSRAIFGDEARRDLVGNASDAASFGARISAPGANSAIQCFQPKCDTHRHRRSHYLESSLGGRAGKRHIA